MSSYLLLRNNRETGPFTFDEIKGMTLKTYDLLWVVGKSAAWRYPGEIAELKSFAPAVPEQPSDPFEKKTSENTVADSACSKKTETSNSGTREHNILHSASIHSVYVNLPAERKQTNLPSVQVLQETSTTFSREPEYILSDNYTRQSSGANRISGRFLWISTIALLFGAGILTGFFISDRRKFFSLDENHPHKRTLVQPAIVKGQKVNSKLITPAIPSPLSSRNPNQYMVSVQTIIPGIKNGVSHTGNKRLKPTGSVKDSTVSLPGSQLTLNPADSLRQISVSKMEALYQKIRAYPVNYLSIITGTYTTGIFGGISSFPVTVTNNSPVTMDLVVVNVEYIQNNEKVFRSEPLTFTDLEPGETVSLKAPKSPRGIKIATHIHIVNIRKLDLSYSD
jgi:hypothetical protein